MDVERIGYVVAPDGWIPGQDRAIEVVLDHEPGSEPAEDGRQGLLPARDVAVQGRCAEDQQVGLGAVRLGVAAGDQATHRVAEQDHRPAHGLEQADLVGQVIQPDVDPLDVRARAARRSEATQVGRPAIEAALGQDAGGPLVAAAMLAQAMNDEDACSGLAGRLPAADRE